jgi:hypothetical protein
MKKQMGLRFFVLMGLALAICLMACGQKGGTFEMVNDRSFSVQLTFYVNNVLEFNITLLPGEKKSYSKNEDFNWRYVLQQLPSGPTFNGNGFLTNGDVFRISVSSLGI